MRKVPFSTVVVLEALLLGLAACGVSVLLYDQYERARAAVQERLAGVAITRAAALQSTATRTVVVQSTATARPPTGTNTRVIPLSATPTRNPTSTSTATPTSSSTPTSSLTPTRTRTPSITPTSMPTPLPSATTLVTATPVVRTTRTVTPPAGAQVATAAPTVRATRQPTSGSFATVSTCDVLDEPGNYRLGADLTAAGNCLTIQASYTILDCNGHSIRGTSFLGYGISVLKYGVLAGTIPSYVEIRNCRLSNFKYGIFVEAGSHLVIHDNDSSNNYDDTDPSTRFGKFLGSTDGGGIRLNNTTDSYVLSNTTLHQAIGIDIRESNNVIVRSNTASDNSAWGINFIGTQNSEASGNTTADNVRKCTWGEGTVGYGCDAGGIVVQGGSNGNLISNNIVSGRNGNGIFIKAHSQPCGDNNTITGNTITSVLYNGVELGFCTGNKINNNVIRDGLDGIWLGFAHDTEIKNNTISNMRNHGIVSNNSRNNMVSGNQISNSNEGIYFYTEDYDRTSYGWLPAGDYRSHENCLCYNTLQGNAVVGIHLKDSTGNQVTNNNLQGNGRSIRMEGNQGGNNTQGNVGWWVPFPLDTSIARLR